MRILATLIFTSLLTGCSGQKQEVRFKHCPIDESRGIVFIADGAGGFFGISKALNKSVKKLNLPLCLSTEKWTHGYRRVLADHIDRLHCISEGKRIAQKVLRYRKHNPDRMIYLFGHSAGCAVALCIAENLPPNTVDNIILLSPSISCGYDLRPSLRSSRKGIDVFYSGSDRYLQIPMWILGNSDRRWRASAGRVGFQPGDVSMEDEHLFQKLRQHAWKEEYQALDHDGGHFGGYKAKYLEKHILPLMPSYRSEITPPLLQSEVVR